MKKDSEVITINSTRNFERRVIPILILGMMSMCGVAILFTRPEIIDFIFDNAPRLLGFK